MASRDSVRRMRVVVVGAGVVGSSVAYHLARAGAAVTLVERAAFPATGVTAASFAWVGDRGGDWPGGAADLRPYVRGDHQRLAAEVPGVRLSWTGSLSWPARTPGPGQDVVGSEEIAALEPRLRDGPQWALWTPTDGAVDPVALTTALVADARRLGVRVVRAAVTGRSGHDGLKHDGLKHDGLKHDGLKHDGLKHDGLEHDGLEHDELEHGKAKIGAGADVVVLANGTGVPAVAAAYGVRVAVGRSPAVLIRATAPPGLVRTIVATDEFEVREARPGHLLMTSSLPPGVAAERVGAAFRADVRLRGWAVGVRPMPPDGPLIGPITPDGRVWMAVMHSAVTLAPTVGRLVAEELVSGRPAPELRRCRPPLPH